MTEWWPAIGETSVWLGTGLGLIWALVSTNRRRNKYLRAAKPPVGQFRWFVLNFVSMGCYLTLISALGLASIHEILPQALFWFLLGLSALAFTTALLFPAIEPVRPVAMDRQSQDPPADPPQWPVRRSA